MLKLKIGDRVSVEGFPYEFLVTGFDLSINYVLVEPIKPGRKVEWIPADRCSKVEACPHQ